MCVPIGILVDPRTCSCIHHQHHQGNPGEDKRRTQRDKSRKLDHTPRIGCNLSGGVGEELFVERDSYFGNARGSMERNGLGRCTQNSLEPRYHHREDNHQPGRWLVATLSGPEHVYPLHTPHTILHLHTASIFSPPQFVVWVWGQKPKPPQLKRKLPSRVTTFWNKAEEREKFFIATRYGRKLFSLSCLPLIRHCTDIKHVLLSCWSALSMLKQYN